MSDLGGMASVEWGKTKLNLLDTPGFNMFVHEAKLVLPVVDAAAGGGRPGVSGVK